MHTVTYRKNSIKLPGAYFSEIISRVGLIRGDGVIYTSGSLPHVDEK